MSKKLPHVPSMPLYPSEADIAAAVLGPNRTAEWSHTAKFLEDKFNLPKVDPLMGGRYWPAVQRFFEHRHGLAVVTPGEAPLQPSSNIRIIPFPPDSKDRDDGPEADPVCHRGVDRRSRRPRT